MTVAIPANSPISFEIKSANLPLVALILKSSDLTELATELKQRFGDMPDFFDGDPLVIDLTPIKAAAKRTGTPAPDIDFPALITLLSSYKVVPIAIRGGTPEQMAAGLTAGLLPAPDARVVANSVPTPPAAAPEPETPPPPGPAETSVPARLTEQALQGAMVIDKPLRSGQQVYARGRDLVVLAIVNAGAEVIADGHIHVYAPLRGKAMAGARGNTNARIFSLSLEAELISIAGVYRTSENPLPANVQGKAIQVRLVASPDGDKLIMDAMD